MNDNSLKISQIIQALQLREEAVDVNGVRTVSPTISGSERTLLINELVKLLMVDELLTTTTTTIL